MCATVITLLLLLLRQLLLPGQMRARDFKTICARVRHLVYVVECTLCRCAVAVLSLPLRCVIQSLPRASSLFLSFVVSPLPVFCPKKRISAMHKESSKSITTINSTERNFQTLQTALALFSQPVRASKVQSEQARSNNSFSSIMPWTLM